MDLAKQDWLDVLDDLIESEGPERVKEILSDLQLNASRKGIRLFSQYTVCKYDSSRSAGVLSR